jgi:hypothetical protein
MLRYIRGLSALPDPVFIFAASRWPPSHELGVFWLLIWIHHSGKGLHKMWPNLLRRARRDHWASPAAGAGSGAVVAKVAKTLLPRGGTLVRLSLFAAKPLRPEFVPKLNQRNPKYWGLAASHCDG